MGFDNRTKPLGLQQAPVPSQPNQPSDSDANENEKPPVQNARPAELPSGNNVQSSRAGLNPPVTCESLGELDIRKTIFNPKLRHDVNFDPQLHFRPNFDGVKGQKKVEQAKEYWARFVLHLSAFLHDPESFEGSWELPIALETVKEILLTLVPERDHPAVKENMDVSLLMQQFKKSVSDVVGLSLWMAQLLKAHCAPMRDDWVDEMVREMEIGSQMGDVESLVNGIKALFGVLEAMKLVSCALAW
jgi:hypothetical protein